MTNYWEVETYTKILVYKHDNQPDGLHQTVVYSSGAPNERCWLECPTITGNESDDYVVVNGDPTPVEGTPGASNLSLSYYEGAHKNTLMDNIRAERDRRINDCEWIMQRHKEETENPNVTITTIDSTKYQEWLDYRQALRDLPQNTVDSRDFDFDNDWPTEPA